MTIDELLSIPTNDSDQCPGCFRFYPVSLAEIERDPSKAGPRSCGHEGCKNKGRPVLRGSEWRAAATAVLEATRAALPANETIEIGGALHVVERRGTPERRTMVLDEEGEHWFSLPGDASADTIRAVAALYHYAYGRGFVWGRAKLQRELRELLGAEARE